MRPHCVLLDRDGVINHDSDAYILGVDDWEPLPGSLAAIARLTRAGIPVAVCTNQSARARGLISAAGLAAIHRRMTAAIEAAGGQLAGVFVCPHGPTDDCDCRKPAPGLLHQALETLDCAPDKALFIGDSRRDLDAARRAGVTAWLVRTGNGRRTEADGGTAVPVYDDLAAAVEALLQ